MINYSVSWSSQTATQPPDTLVEGIAKHRQGALDEAFADYLHALRQRPDRVLACYNLGVVLIDSGLGLSAMPFLKRALLQWPTSETLRAALLHGFLRSGRWADAERLLADAEQSGLPAQTQTRWRAWIDACATGQDDDSAIPLPADSVHEPPDSPLTLATTTAVSARLQDTFARAIQLYQSGQFDALEHVLAPLLVEFPSWGEGHHLRGLGHMALKRHAQARVSLERAGELIPGRGELWDHLGVLYAQLGEVDNVLAAFEQALTLNPLRAETWNNAADAALRRGQLDVAFQYALQAARLNPDLAEAVYCLVQAAYKLGEAGHESGDDALKTAVQLIKAQTDTPERAMAAAPVFAQVGLFEHATDILEQSLARSGNQPPTLLGELVRNQYRICDWRDLATRQTQLRALAQASETSVIAPFTAMTLADFGPSDLLRIARARALIYRPWSERAHELSSPTGMPSKQRLRIGYLSDDFQEHATAYLTASLFERHDRDRFEIFAYSTGLDEGGQMRQRLINAFEHFVDIRSLGHLEAAQRIRDDAIDILVDLKGYTTGSRLEILALRPSPLQVSWLGFPGGLGAPFIDYLIADRVVAPPEHAGHYDEALAYLPDTYAPVDDARPVGQTPTRADAGLPDSALVLCCFNDPYKITPAVFDCWCELLRETPDAVLWLYARTGVVRDTLMREAQARGVAPERLIFADKLPQPEHLARIALADLFLDTLPVNAHTTASDALWMGVPVLTCMGETFASRVAASLLSATGITELITTNLDQYRAVARQLIEHPAELAALRARLANARVGAALFDSRRFTRNLEALYLRMWTRHTGGGSPHQLDAVQSGDT